MRSERVVPSSRRRPVEALVLALALLPLAGCRDRFTGLDTWAIPDCEGRRKQAQEKRNPDDLRASKEGSAVPIPRVQLPASFSDAGWRVMGLGTCAAFIDGNRHGFTVHGGKGKAKDATMRVVVSPEGVLFVEVADDRWATSGKSWVTNGTARNS